MFIRIKSTPNSPRRSVQIVASIRDGEKVRQKIMRHVGVAMNDFELEKLKDLAEHIKAQLENEHQPSLWSAEEMASMAIKARKQKENDEPLTVNLKHLREEQRTILGIHEAYGALYEELGFQDIFSNPARQKASSHLLFNIVMARIAQPSSKRAAVQMLERDFGIKLPLEKVYRMMDKIDDNVVNRLQMKAYEAAKLVLQEKINVVFYDCTTLYFESFEQDDFKQNGYSKDMKFNQPQVLLALMVTEEGLPIGYEAFPGATFEGHTLINAVERVQEKYQLNKVVFVADRGLLSETNLATIEAKGLQYIVASKLKSLPHAVQKEILNKEQYQAIENNDSVQSLFDHPIAKRRLVVSYSTKRATKDKHDREKAIEQLTKKLSKHKNPKALLNNYGYKKYLTVKGDANLSLNIEKIKADEQWDGLHGVITNIKDMSAEGILAQYRGLWQIEECFRISKHDLKIRPIFHWTPERVKAHIAIAFMSLVCVRHMTYRVALQYQKLSAEVIRKELVHVQMSFLKHLHSNDRFCIPSNISQHAKKIYHLMGLKISTTPFKLEKA